jgi:hypothetical protein
MCENTENLHTDHINKKTKLFNISTGIQNFSKKKLWKEIKKCQLLCNKCHKIKSAKERLAEHGTKSRYKSRSFPCRCVLCKNAYNVWHRNDRRRRRELGLKVW